MKRQKSHLETYLQAVRSALAESALFAGLDAGASFVATLLGFRFLDSFGLLLLIEGAVFMLVGGALGFAGQPGVRRIQNVIGGRVSSGQKREPTVKEADVRAAFYMLIGICLFGVSLVISLAAQSFR